MRLFEVIRQRLQENPAAPALEYKGSWTPRATVAAGIDAIDRLLTASGIGPGVAIALLCNNRPAAATAMLAVAMTERCVITLSPAQGMEPLIAELRDLRPRAVIAEPEDWRNPELLAVARELGLIGVSVDLGSPALAALVPECSSAGPGPWLPDMPGVAFYMSTSGTTGRPKRLPMMALSISNGVMVAADTDPLLDAPAPADLMSLTSISYSPIGHLSGMFYLMTPFYLGRPLALLEKFNIPEWRVAMQRYRPKFTGLPPAAIRMVLDAKVPKEELACLVAVRAGTAPLDALTRARWDAAYGIPVLANYGSTEFAGAVTAWSIEDFRQYGESKAGSAGRPRTDVTLRIADRETGAILPVGEVGLVEVKAMRFGPAADWKRTTDLGRLDEDGFLYVLGRADNAINRGGFKIVPDLVVEALAQHPSVKEVGVVGIADARLGEVPVAGVELHSGAAPVTEAELIAFARTVLKSYEVPTQIRILEALPRTISLKIDLPRMRALYFQ